MEELCLAVVIIDQSHWTLRLGLMERLHGSEIRTVDSIVGTNKTPLGLVHEMFLFRDAGS